MRPFFHSAQPLISDFENQKFKQLAVIMNRHGQFSVAIRDVEFGRRPGTAYRFAPLLFSLKAHKQAAIVTRKKARPHERALKEFQ